MNSLKSRPNLSDSADLRFTSFIPNQSAEKCFKFEPINLEYKKIEYHINEYGFRHRTDTSKKLILFCGCSVTFGTGLAEEDTFAHLVTAGLGNNYDYINLGLPGTGPDVQMLNLTWALNNFKIDKIFWYISDYHRQVFTKDNKVIGLFTPSFFGQEEWFQQSIGKSFVEVNALLEDTWRLKTFWNLYSLFSLIKSKNIETFVSSWEPVLDSELEKLRNEFSFNSLGNIDIVDVARDDMHPGILSNLQFAEKILKRTQL
jgi:hypothetical protein